MSHGPHSSESTDRSVSDMLHSSDSPFTTCERCGRIHLRRYSHACDYPTDARDESGPLDGAALRALDRGDPDDWVLISPNTRTGRRYHIVGVDGDPPPRCPAQLQRDENDEWREVTRKGAHHRNCRPCLKCHRFGRELVDPDADE